jgi:hexosaminidase
MKLNAFSPVLLLWFCAAIVALPAEAKAQLPDLLPVPAQMTVSDGWSDVDAGFHCRLTGYLEPRLTRAVARLKDRLHNKSGLTFRASHREAMLDIACAGPAPTVQSVRDDESYTLDIAYGHAMLRAANPLGVMHGLVTFAQLVQRHNNGYGVPNVHIVDNPRFRWRGLLLDVSRHWIPVDVVERNLDLMEQCKLNVFHWHLSDDQGFRVESKVFPKLQQDGSDGLYYTQAQIKSVIAYARDRGIRIVPEFDMPGHSTSWFVGYPELASALGPYAIARHRGVFDPVMDPTREETYRWLDQFIGEMTALFPDPYFHIGGDEVNGNQWNANPRIRAFMQAHSMTSTADLQAYFNRRLYAIVAKHRKTMMGWDEILRPDLPSGVVVQSWRGSDTLAKAARQGCSAVLSSGYYLDSRAPASEYYLNDPQEGAAADLTGDQQQRLLGGEACMWGEEITQYSATARIWPRTAAIAERLWSPKSVRDVDSMERRISQFIPYPPSSESPFHGAPAVIPGIIQAVDYDNGGEGVGYHDTADYNAGAEYRPHDNVGIEPCADTDGGYNIGHTAAGEWLRYTVDVKHAGLYTVSIRVADDGNGRRLHFEDSPIGNHGSAFRGTRIGPDFIAPSTGGWQTWTTIAGTLTLPAGKQVLTLVEDTGDCSIHSIRFYAVDGADDDR